MKKDLAVTFLAVVALSHPADATESGNGAYLLGSRDTFAGIVPKPGTYITNNFVFMNGDGPTLSLGGVPVTERKSASISTSSISPTSSKRRFSAERPASS